MKANLTFATMLCALALSSCGSSPSTPTSSGAEGSSSSVSSKSEFAPKDWDLHANAPSLALASDFAYGVDCSSILEVEKGGGKFYDLEGKQRDVFEILAEGGANYARIRLWNDPYDRNGNRYGGGTNDLASDIVIAKRAQAAGMKILLDFHYSDSWVDPGKYWAPKAWRGLSYDETLPLLSAFTSESLQAFKDEGVTVSSIQIGNEINPGIAGFRNANYNRIGGIMREATKAAKSVFPDVKTIIHYTNITSSAQIYKWLDNLASQEEGSLPDVIGVSYYPFWHGDLNNLQEVLNHFATTYDREVMVVETSWGHTDDPAGEYHCNNQFNSNTLGEAGGYATSTQAQVTQMADVIDVLSKVPNQKGTGVFYWEPAWLPNAYSGWITKEGAYYNDNGRDWIDKKVTEEELEATYGGSYCWSSWANQAWFDYQGHALSSVDMYRHIAIGDHPLEEKVLRLHSHEVSVTVNLSEEWALPSTLKVETNLDAYRDIPVTWNQNEIDAIVNPGHYAVHGQAGGESVTINIKAEKNFISDPSFQRQGCKNESAVVAPWNVVTTTTYKDFGDAHIEAKNEMGKSGNQYFHWYSTQKFEFSLTQDLGKVPAGIYNFGFSLLASWYEGGQDAGAVLASSLWYSVDGEKISFDIREQFGGYSAGVVNVDESPVILEKEAEIVIGFDLSAEGKAWGHADDFYFSAAIE